ncbi:MAG: hypothetical protein ACYS7M_03605, partial [Planctomycetota bacterium]
MHYSDSVREEELRFGEQIGQVVGLVAASRKIGAHHLVVLGLVTRSGDSETLEYRVAASRSGPAVSADWGCSSALIARPKGDPFDSMAIALPRGDSMIFTLEHMKRVDNTTTMETTRFINHCVIPTYLDTGMMYRVSSTRSSDGDATQAGKAQIGRTSSRDPGAAS